MKPKKKVARKKTAASPRTRSAASTKPKSSAKPPAKEPRSAATRPRKAAAPKARAKRKSVKEPVVEAKPASVAAPDLPAPAPEAITVRPKVEKPAPRKVPARIPPILLEADKPEPVAVSGPGKRYELGPTPPLERLESEGRLPDAYGTQHLLLAARDPHWLYAHWDLSREQQQRYNSLSVDGHLVLRVHLDALSGERVDEIHLHPESRHWFVPVEKAGAKYVAELGYYSTSGRWTSICESKPVLTPRDTVSAETKAEFVTVPVEMPITQLLALVQESVQEAVAPSPEPEKRAEPAVATKPDRKTPAASQGKTEPELKRTAAPSWTPEQEQALAGMISMDQVRKVWMGSMEIAELIRREVARELASMAAAQLGGEAPTSPAFALGAISSPGGERKGKAKGFWFNVNAELIIYGATEANATVTIGGRKITLRPDGSFSYRFALPDGDYTLPIVAVSADESDGRSAELKFSRGTDYKGNVGAHPQDPRLKAPTAANL